MTPTELELFTKLQPQFKERIGNPQHGDACFLNGEADIYCEDCLENKVFSSKIYNDAIWLPRDIDRENPRRGLVGMIDNFMLLFKHYYSDSWGCKIDIEAEDKTINFDGATPTEALLRALDYQWRQYDHGL